MTEKSKKPRLRFKGFTETWEQRKLGNIAAKVTEKNTQNSIKETFTNSAEMGVVSQRDFFDHDIAKADKIDGYYIVQENDFIYNPRISVTAPCGPINRNKLGRKGVMSPLYTVFRTNGINPLFLEWYFKSSCWYAYMYFNGDSGARSDRFSIKNELFFDMPIPLPKDDEQWRIGLLLESLNNLITLHQRKYDKLVAVKKSLLEKMFPAVGETVPKIRFKGFSDAWEQRKLGDVLQTLPFKVYLKSPEQHGEFEIIQQGNTPIIGYANGEPCKDYEDTVIFGDHTLSLYKPKSPFFVATDGVRIVKGFDNMDGNYLLPLLERNKPQSEGYKRYYSILADIDVFFTENHEEQSKIGEYFSDIDNLITLHQRQLERLKNIKAALLEKMFV